MIHQNINTGFAYQPRAVAPAIVFFDLPFNLQAIKPAPSPKYDQRR